MITPERVNDSISEHPHIATNVSSSLGIPARKSRRLIGQTCFGDAQPEQLHLPSSGSRGLVLDFELDDADTAFVETGVSYEITDVKHCAPTHN